MKKAVIIVFAVMITATLRAQYPDSLPVTRRPFSARSFIVPGIMIGYGFVALKYAALQNVNKQFQAQLWLKRPHSKVIIDNYFQFTPAVMVYLLNEMHIHGKNNFEDRTLVYALSNVIMASVVYPLKQTTHQLRPDSSDYHSFPSGHTAEAFLCAEFLRHEYKNISNGAVWAGYAIALATGGLRMYNNKHSFADVITGAGIGMASTRLAYWISPFIKNKFFKHKTMNTVIVPVFQLNELQVHAVHFF